MTTATISNETHCACGKAFADDATDFLPGYARKADTDERVCYPCAAASELADLHATGRAVLYLSGEPKYHPTLSTQPFAWLSDVKVGNWTGLIKFNVTGYNRGLHNIAGKRTNVWFTDDKGGKWWGVSYGDNTQLIHCKRLKGRA